ncbi:flap endonuclease GEN homolog 1 isoform X2 [Phodopus roborovskii]|uniref:Flap endonuclease GEN homolog 1 n=1 Tax=Phodopus roborovskii TaxID=109678 RepID=A0AAU9Z4D0_PHORO|nr:flap endonuclease GEN homolog 1 isoform X2 [Phodopus roborovskii]CAH6786838.1 Gen1 [Phodopus roborovskii]
MGVNDLWQILEPVKQHIHLQDLSGKTIAVDLSLWVCEAQTVKKMIGTVMKPHLRNLFFRISYLTQMNVKLVFVMEGEPPKLKADVMSKRTQTRYGPSGKPCSQRTGRSHFKSILRECLEMLDCLGIPWVQAVGEAEAMCAYLNASGHVDGCLTNDGDAFLYGAQTVYRNFTMNTKDPHVDCYTVSSIKSKLGLDRDALVGLAVLLGCDYLPKGVPGVGKEQALKLLRILKGQSLLQRFNQWIIEPCSSIPQSAAKNVAHCSVCSHPGSPKDHERKGCTLCKSDRYCEPHDYEYCCPCEWHQTNQNRQLNEIENNIKKKACSCKGFPFHEVIQEFLLNKDKMLKPIRYQRPDLLLFQRFTVQKMEWPSHYACEKLLVLLTRYDMTERKLGRKNSGQLQPIRIVKPRIRNGVRCLEIEWEKPEYYAMEDTEAGELDLLTVEEASLFEAAYPEVVAVYQKQQSETQGKKQKSMKVKPKGNSLSEMDNVVSSQSLMTLKPKCEVLPKHTRKTNLEISPDPILPQESTSPSLSNLVFPESAPCLNLQEHFMPPPRPVAGKQTKDVSNFLVSECSEPSSSSHNISVIANLHLSTIDWEGTSFSNSPAVQRNSLSQDLQSELESSSILPGFENTPEQCTANNEVLGRDLQKIAPEEHLLSDITGLYLHDLPLKERIHLKSSCPLYNVQADANLESLPLKVKSSCIIDSNSGCLSDFSKEFPGIYLHKESKNLKVLNNQLLQENSSVDTSIPYSFDDKAVKTSLKVEPPNTVLPHNPKVDEKTTKNLVKKSVCLKRDSSDEENDLVSWETKNTASKMKHGSQKHSLAQGRDKLRNPKVDAKETRLCTKSYTTAEGEENSFSDPGERTQSFLPSHKKDEDSAAYLDSPLPLCQRLKLRFQNT